MKTCLTIFNFVAILLVHILCGCSHDSSRKNNTGIGNHTSNEKYNSRIEIFSPVAGSRYTCGDPVEVIIRSLDTLAAKPDSIGIYINNLLLSKAHHIPFAMQFNTASYPVGTLSISLIIYKDHQKDHRNIDCILLSDIIPKKLEYEIVNTYPHDEGAYTQGLVYEDGYFYEGTGENGRSSLRKVDAKTGEVLKIYRLLDDIFGEGIAVLNDRIFQITYKSQHGYVYDKESFEIIQKIYYNFREGWGLTFNNQTFVMSDGSHHLYMLDTVHFTEIDRIEVYDNTGAVRFLNELEYVNGKIYANIYGNTKIVIIDPSTGKVESYLECQNLVPEKLKQNTNKVLNGIAYNAQNHHLYLTGKDWPVLYEIKLK